MSLAPPVSKDGFSYAGDIFAEASGHNRHRRATVAELRDHFQRGSEKDHPAHWFEAQLIHYGLQVSKTKAVARMRLFDAVNGGNLAVPAHIQRLEADLKKEWIKKEREAKKALKDTAAPSSPAPKTPATARGKRKAESANIDFTVSVGDINVTVSASQSAKKVKSSSSKSATTTATVQKAEPKPRTPRKLTTAAAPATKTTASRSTASKTTVSKTTVSKTTTTTTKATGSASTARRGGISQGPSRASTTPAPAPAPRPLGPRSARRGGAWAGRGRGTATATAPPYHHSSASPTPSSPVKNEYSDDDDNGYNGYTGSVKREDNNDDGNDGEELKPLGLLNGRYELTSEMVASEWGHTDLSLVFTLSGTELWGLFDLGVVSGVMRVRERPWQSSNRALRFTWRGRELEGPIMYGDGHGGWLRFLGGGRVEGELDFMGITFEGRRAAGQGMRSEVHIGRMKAEWEGYCEEEYERENRNRW
ncbi:uncharacterized protein F4812DRAFT_164585 [Daldinia caldariorum]|uniref:uncharacterized protein n=1 Tax=Daldinia caldariorum TaxID=326644 RepID=UPI0020084DEA|nr:uncharacterized protein F4812DRAFT_164585 [Daldinia caldariorum]KAI1471047.1 hypothetical protein F4812DRAFT_164585 [Daldinia caldariorum]